MPDVSLNAVPAAAAARQPRGAVVVNGVALPWMSWEVDSNAFYSADTFTATFALSQLPPGYGADWFAGQEDIVLDIRAGFPTNAEVFAADELDSLILGRVDDLSFDPAARVLELSGRDLTSHFIDAKTSDKWPNKTASEIVAALAARHGMDVKATPTTTKVGTYYQIDHARMSVERSEWDMLCWLAHQEGFMVYVRGRTLHFEPLEDDAARRYVLRWQPPAGDVGHHTFNGTGIRFKRNLTVVKDVVVEVRSWNAKQKKGFSATYPQRRARGPAVGTSGDTARQIYRFTRPGLTPEQALQFAQAEFRKITAHEMRMEGDMPADNLLDATKVIEVQGTGTAFDQTYFPESINRRMSMADGYRMTIAAKNSRPQTAGIE